jgi:hypothetical protein
VTRRPGWWSWQRQWRRDVAVLIGVGEAYGTLQVLRVVKLHIYADVLRKAPSE